jgi:uncharacterized delta-60 repeat protein
VLVAGQATIPNGGIQMAVARFTAEGALDTTFSTNGRLLINFPGNTEVATGIELLAGGKILIVGHAINGATSTFALARLTSSGALDPSFDGDGKMLVVFPGTSYSQASDVAVMGPVETTLPGWYAVVGTAHDTSVEQDRMAVAFFKPDGTLEPTFSGDGMRLVGFSSALAHTGMSVSFDLSSRIVLGGSAVINGKSRLALARMSTTGTLDSTFSADGRSTFEVPDMQGAAIFETVIGNSLITAVGVAIDPSIGNYTVVARFNADGTPAGSFANGAGYLVHDEPFALYDQAVAVTRNGSDKLTVVGWIANP